ncbi:MAG TPA: LysM domain-containing protein [Mycobacterium sp.]|jgi:hypothetical protein|nr:LysM domain-containing protein [Mycobacterium sp.]
MSDPIDTFVAAGGTSGGPTAPNSRYFGVATLTWTQPDGTIVRYLQRRVIPQPEQYATMRQYVTVQGDRIDYVANVQVGDPLLYWILCDANAVMDPDALTDEPGRVVRITLPAGIGTGGMTGGTGGSSG